MREYRHRRHLDQPFSILQGAFQPPGPVFALNGHYRPFIQLVGRLFQIRFVHEAQKGMTVTVLGDHREIRHHFTGHIVSPLTPDARECPRGPVSALEAPPGVEIVVTPVGLVIGNRRDQAAPPTGPRSAISHRGGQTFAPRITSNPAGPPISRS